MGLEAHHSICWRSERSFCAARTISVLFIRVICRVSKVGGGGVWRVGVRRERGGGMKGC